MNHQNMNKPKTFPSKILLFGEYGILLGSAGLAIPYPDFHGTLRFERNASQAGLSTMASESNHQIKLLWEHLNDKKELFGFLDLNSFGNDIENGLWFDSNIPQGYGVGSSGALTAAIFDQYSFDKAHQDTLSETRKKLAEIEKYFHGTSSGLDPLVSLTNQPVLVENGDKVTLPDVPHFSAGIKEKNLLSGLFLVDSGVVSPTGNLVEWFLEQYQDWEFRRAVNEVYFPAIEQAIGALLQNNFRSFQMSYETITGFQMQFLNPLIPSTLMDYLEHGLLTGSFFLKLCGSGGGGFMLGLTTDGAKTEEYFKSKGINTLFL